MLAVVGVAIVAVKGGGGDCGSGGLVSLIIYVFSTFIIYASRITFLISVEISLS